MNIETLTVYLSSETFPSGGDVSTSQTFVYNDLTDVTFNLRDVNRGENNDYIGIYKTEFNFNGTSTKFFNSTLSAVNGNYLYVPPATVNNLYGSDFQGISAEGYAKFYYSNGNTSTIILNVYKSDFNVADLNLNLLGIQSYSLSGEKSLLVIKDKHNNAYTMSRFSPPISLPASSVQTFELIPDVLSVNEGDQVTITLNTQGLSDGNVVSYKISGDGITADDFTGLDSLDGTFTVIDNTASVILNISNDITTEGAETFSLSLDNGEASTGPITINDTSTPGPQINYHINQINGDHIVFFTGGSRVEQI